MPTVIDELVVTFGLDPSRFNAEQAKVVKKLQDTSKTSDVVGKNMANAGNNAAQFFSKIRNEALGLVGVLVGGAGLASLLASTTKNLSDLGRSAKNIGMDPGELTMFRNAVQANGGSAEEATASFQRLTDQMAELRVTGKTASLPFLNQIGVVRGDNPMQTYMKFVKFATDHKNDVPLINLIGKGLGLDQGSINEAMRGSTQVVADFGEALRRGVPTPQQIANFTALERAFNETKQTATNLANILLDRFAPALTAILKAVTEFMIAHPDIATALGVAGPVAGAVGGAWAGWRMLKGLFGAGGGSGPAPGAPASGGLVAGLLRRLGPLAFLGLTGSAGGEDPEFSKEKNEEYKRNHPRSDVTPAGAGVLGADRGAAPAITGNVQERGRGVIAQLMGLGWSKEAAAGLAANFQQESGFKADSVGDGGQAYGIGQWHPDRQAAFARVMGKPIQGSSVEEQVSFAHWELNNSERSAGNRLRGAKTASDAGSIASQYYERPADRAGEASRRGLLAEKWNAGTPVQASNDPSWTGSIQDALKRQTAIAAGAGGGQQAANSNSQNVTIASLVVNSAAKDAAGIATDIKGAIQRRMLVPQANTGLA